MSSMGLRATPVSIAALATAAALAYALLAVPTYQVDVLLRPIQTKALEAVNAAREAALARARIYCCRHLYPGVSIDIAGMHLQTTDEHNQCQICHRDGELVVEPLLDIP